MLGRRKDVTPARGARLWLAGAMALGLAQAASAAPAQQDAARDYDTQDARLNAVYKKLSQSLDDAGRKALREEERQWIAGRDQSCGVPAGSVVKNACTTTQTSFRADQLQKRLREGVATPQAGGAPSVVGDWGYSNQCDFGHFVELNVARDGPTTEGTWSDGTRVRGNEGEFKGQWRDGRLYVKFCANSEERGGPPACPKYGEDAAYMAFEGKSLVWNRAGGPEADQKFQRYVVMQRKSYGGDVPEDKNCSTSAP